MPTPNAVGPDPILASWCGDKDAPGSTAAAPDGMRSRRRGGGRIVEIEPPPILQGPGALTDRLEADAGADRGCGRIRDQAVTLTRAGGI